MKSNFIFWALFIILGGIVFCGNVLLDNLKNAPTQNNKAQISHQKESECLERLIKDIIPYTDKLTCDGFEYVVPKHWYLYNQNICDGKVGGGIILNIPGLNNYEFRKKMWKELLDIMALAFLGQETTEFGNDFENLLNIFKSSLEIAGWANVGLEGVNSIIKETSHGSFKVFTLELQREKIGKITRDLIFQNKKTTFKNALIRLSKDLNNNIELIDKIENLSNIPTGLLYLEKGNLIVVPEEKFYEIIILYTYREFLYQIAEKIKSCNGLDPALINVCDIILSSTSTELQNSIKEFIKNREDKQFYKSLLSIVKTSASIGSLLSKFQILKSFLVIIDVILASWDMYENFVECGYAMPLCRASLGYTLSKQLLGEDAFGNLISSLALIIADKSIYSYYDPEFVNIFINVPSLFTSYRNNDIGTKWHKVVFDENRNKEINYLIKGYSNGGEPCSSNLKGMVVDVNRNPLSYADVSLYNEKDIITQTYTNFSGPVFILKTNAYSQKTYTNDLGYFYFKIMEDGNYILRISKSDYCTEVVKTYIKNGVPQFDIITVTLQKPANNKLQNLQEKYYAYSTGTSIKIGVELTNELCRDIVHIIPFGTTFRNNNKRHQDILSAKEYRLTAFANSKTKYELLGYCISRYRMGVDGELTKDTTLSKEEYTVLTKLADTKGYHVDNYNQVQNAIWFFSDKVGLEKGSVAEDLVKKTIEILPQNKSNMINRIGIDSSIRVLLNTVIISLVLYLYNRKNTL